MVRLNLLNDGRLRPYLISKLKKTSSFYKWKNHIFTIYKIVLLIHEGKYVNTKTHKHIIEL